MLFALIDRFLEPFSPVLLRSCGDRDGWEMPLQPTTDLLVRHYYQNAQSGSGKPRVEEDECS